jgi:hypothetical protein
MDCRFLLVKIRKIISDVTEDEQDFYDSLRDGLADQSRNSGSRERNLFIVPPLQTASS